MKREYSLFLTVKSSCHKKTLQVTFDNTKQQKGNVTVSFQGAHPGAPTHSSSGTGNDELRVGASASFKALCAVAAFHQVAADPATLAHQMGLGC
jgi:hypothetical protein